MTNFLITITLILFSLGQLGRLSFLDQQINFYLYEVGVILILLSLFIKKKFQPLISNRQLTNALIIFISALLLSFMINLSHFNSTQNIIAGLYIIRLLMYLIFAVYLVNQKLKIYKIVIIFTVVTLIVGFVQYFLYPDLRNLFYDGWDPHLFRIFGQFFDTSIAGAIYGLLFLYFIQKGRVKPNKLNIFLLILLLLFIVLTFSRSLYLALIFTSVVYLFKNKLSKIVFYLIIMFFVLVIIVPKPSGEGVNLTRMFSIDSRVEDYKVAINLWSKKPIFGYGYNHIRDIKNTNQTVDNHAASSFHSSFLNILVTGGVVGLVAYLFFLFKFFSLRIYGVYYGVFLIIMSHFDNILLHPFILFLTAILLFDISQ